VNRVPGRLDQLRVVGDVRAEFAAPVVRRLQPGAAKTCGVWASHSPLRGCVPITF